MIDTTWSIRETEMGTTARQSLEEYRRLEYPHESMGWLYRTSGARPAVRRRSVLRRFLGWVGLGNDVPTR